MNIEPGYWYVKSHYKPFYEIVSVSKMLLGPDEGKLGVWSIDYEGYNLIEDYTPDQFIKPVPEPFGDY